MTVAATLTGDPVAANRSLVLGFGPCPFRNHKGRELVIFVPKGSEQQLVFECLDPLLGAMRAAGFRNVHFTRFLNGVCAAHSGFKL